MFGSYTYHCGSNMLGKSYKEISNEFTLTVNLHRNNHYIEIFSITEGEDSILNKSDFSTHYFFPKCDENHNEIENEYIDEDNVSMSTILLKSLENIDKYKNKKISFKYKIVQ